MLWKAIDFETSYGVVSFKLQNVMYPDKYMSYTSTQAWPYAKTVESNASGAKTFNYNKNGNYMYYDIGSTRYYVNYKNIWDECGYPHTYFDTPEYKMEYKEGSVKFVVTNTYVAPYELPNSGGIGTYIFTIAGFALLTLAFEKIFGFKKIK